MTNITKKPHFVPAAYLQYWDVGQNPNGRESSIYWCDGNICTKQKLKNVAVQSGLYSKDAPNSAEEYLSEFESDWSKLVNQLINGRVPQADILASMLLLHSSYFLLRNPKFSKKGDLSRIEIYKQAIEGYWRDVLMAGEIPDKIEDAAAQMLSVWTCHLVMAQGEPWITSDNPVLILSIQGVTPAIIFLPITPKWALIALNNNVVHLSSNKMTSQDTNYLNTYTTVNSIRCVFSDSTFQETDIKSISKWFNRRPETENWIAEGEIHIEPFNYPISTMSLSFL